MTMHATIVHCGRLACEHARACIASVSYGDDEDVYVGMEMYTVMVEMYMVMIETCMVMMDLADGSCAW